MITIQEIESNGYEIRLDGIYSHKSKKYIKGSLNNRGYITTGLYINSKSYWVSLHSVIAMKFIPNPENKKTVNHINGIKNDNRIENLEWNTYSENHLHAFRTGLKKTSELQKNLMIELRSKLVLDTLTGIFYNSCKDAAIAKGIKYFTLAGKLNGNNPNNTSLIYC
jgi:hypothetical protein